MAQLVPAKKADFLFVADSGPGETNEKGLIVPKFGNKPENHVAVMMSFESLSEMFLITRMHYQCWLTSWYQENANQPAQKQGQYSENQKSRTVLLFRCSDAVRAAGSKILAAFFVFLCRFGITRRKNILILFFAVIIQISIEKGTQYVIM